MVETTSSTIIIKRSIKEEHNGTVRMVTPIIENGKEYAVYVEVEEAYSPYLCFERADALVYLALPVAIRCGYDIYCETPVTEMFLHNLNEILIPQLAIGDHRAYKIKIHAETDSTIIGGEGVGTGISCGVDSLFTVKKYSNSEYHNMNLTHLFIANINMELLEPRNASLYEWIEHNKEEFDRFEAVAKSINVPVVKVYTNYFYYLCGREFNRDWTWYHHLFVHNYITMASVLALKKLWKVYYFSSSYDFMAFSIKNNITNDPAHYEVVCMHTLTVPDFTCFSAGADYNRLQKTIDLFDYKIAHTTLHPCHLRGAKNCTKPTCDKCLRALIPLDYYDRLDDFSQVFNLEMYRKNRNEYFYNLVRLYNDKFSHVFYEEIYEMAKEKWPSLMEKEEARYKKESAPTVAKWEYNIVKSSYEIVLDLLKMDNPALFLCSFFAEKRIKKIYVTGAPQLIKTIKELMLKCESFDFIDYKSGRPSDCDGAFIGDAANSIVAKKKEELINKGMSYDKIYSIFDLKTALDAYSIK